MTQQVTISDGRTIDEVHVVRLPNGRRIDRRKTLGTRGDPDKAHVSPMSSIGVVLLLLIVIALWVLAIYEVLSISPVTKGFLS